MTMKRVYTLIFLSLLVSSPHLSAMIRKLKSVVMTVPIAVIPTDEKLVTFLESLGDDEKVIALIREKDFPINNKVHWSNDVKTVLTPLGWAANKRKPLVVKALIKAGASITDEILDQAIENCFGTIETLKILLEAGARSLKPFKTWYTDIAELLLSHGLVMEGGYKSPELLPFYFKYASYEPNSNSLNDNRQNFQKWEKDNQIPFSIYSRVTFPGSARFLPEAIDQLREKLPPGQFHKITSEALAFAASHLDFQAVELFLQEHADPSEAKKVVGARIIRKNLQMRAAAIGSFERATFESAVKTYEQLLGRLNKPNKKSSLAQLILASPARRYAVETGLHTIQAKTMSMAKATTITASDRVRLILSDRVVAQEVTKIEEKSKALKAEPNSVDAQNQIRELEEHLKKLIARTKSNAHIPALDDPSHTLRPAILERTHALIKDLAPTQQDELELFIRTHGNLTIAALNYATKNASAEHMVPALTIKAKGESLVPLLMLALKYGNTEQFNKLIAADVSVNCQDSENDKLSPLMYAVNSQNAAAVQQIINRASKENALVKVLACQNRLGQTALILACIKGNEEIVRLLLAAGARDMVHDTSQNYGFDYALNLSSDGVMNLLIEHGDFAKMMQRKDANGTTMLMKAASQGFGNLAVYLMKRGVALGEADNAECRLTALHYAAGAGNTEIVKAMIDCLLDPTISIYETVEKKNPPLQCLLRSKRLPRKKLKWIIVSFSLSFSICGQKMALPLPLLAKKVTKSLSSFYARRAQI